MDHDLPSDADLAAALSAAERTPAAVVQPTPRPSSRRRAAASSILVSPRQKGNPVLEHLRAQPWEYADTAADYVLGATTCALFLSLRYHRLHPEYVHGRIRALRGRFGLRVLLATVDVADHEAALRELTAACLAHGLTLVLAWSAREAARYLEAYRALEGAPPTGIRGPAAAGPGAAGGGYAARVLEFVTVPRGVNRADALALVGAFGSVGAAVGAGAGEVAALGGWGPRKVAAWTAACREPFRARRAAAARGEGGRRVRKVGMAVAAEEEEEDRGPGMRGDDHDDEGVEEDGEEALLLLERLAAAADPVAAGAKRPRAPSPEPSEGVRAALAGYRTTAAADEQAH